MYTFRYVSFIMTKDRWVSPLLWKVRNLLVHIKIHWRQVSYQKRLLTSTEDTKDNTKSNNNLYLSLHIINNCLAKRYSDYDLSLTSGSLSKKFVGFYNMVQTLFNSHYKNKTLYDLEQRSQYPFLWHVCLCLCIFVLSPNKRKDLKGWLY